MPPKATKIVPTRKVGPNARTSSTVMAIVSKIRVSRKGMRSGGQSFSRGALHELLSNPIYLGEIRHQRERRFWTEGSGRRFRNV